mmetsp:Transcript_37940/g.84525  ORF Transcript_37940/g.84525 Transcript_37940/m.84525 type:complete len:89 (-) Transcript_37940:232-498(-)
MEALFATIAAQLQCAQRLHMPEVQAHTSINMHNQELWLNSQAWRKYHGQCDYKGPHDNSVRAAGVLNAQRCSTRPSSGGPQLAACSAS